MNSLINQKSANGDQEDKGVGGNDTRKEDTLKKKINHGSNNNDTTVKERGHLGFVKVNMDGLQIGRKVDFSAHSCYETLAQTLEDMFFRPSTTINSIRKSLPFFFLFVCMFLVSKTKLLSYILFINLLRERNSNNKGIYLLLFGCTIFIYLFIWKIFGCTT